jgi:nucleotide-binding universal stress UspA family protein
VYKNILIYIDQERKRSWEHVLPEAISIARQHKANLNVLSIVPDFGMTVVEQFFPEGADEKLNQTVMKGLKRFIKEHLPDDIPVRPIVAEGSVRESILKIADKISADLIILPPKIRKSPLAELGATAAHVARHARCSVLIVRPPVDWPAQDKGGS